MHAVGADGPRPQVGDHAVTVDEEKHPAQNDVTSAAVMSDDHAKNEEDNNSNNGEFQDGVKRVRAITTAWSKWTLFTMFALLYLVTFVDYLQNAVDSALNPYITSSFGSHGLLNVGSVLSTIIGACAPLGLSKIIDVLGRVEGFTLMLLVSVIGSIMKAVAKNVSTYVAAHTLYWTGHIGIGYVVRVMLSDMSSLKNRMLVIGFNQTPRIISNLAGPNIAAKFLNGLNFRWAFGAFAIILVGCSLPAMGLMTYMFRKALKNGLFQKRAPSGRKWHESVKHYVIEIDLAGMLLIMGALSCILLPFSLVRYAPQQWKTPYIIAMLVLGVILFPVFYIWEAKFAPVQFLPWKYLKQGTIIGSCLLYGIMFLSTFTWNGYFNSYLQVVHRQSVEHAGYIVNTYSLTSSFFGPIIGYIIHKTGNFKWTAYSGVPIMLLGTALILPFRQPDAPVGILVFTQFLVGLGSEVFVICSSLAVMAPVTHQYIAVTNALAGLFGGFGASIGLSIAGGIWNNLLPQELYNRLPEAAKGRSAQIFGDIKLQMSFPDGSPERDAIVAAYAHVMRYMLITGVALMPLCLLSIVVWKNINVKKIEEERGKQTKGTTF
ncbi:hypothetical protein JDV02_000125 [Purpureocillium takamizusanense]|uniref:Siderophore iron transporter mirB n=1 Tax=Purpureocillium takamizusanense TaxID=2060973 RepID=A0A9Q8Q5H8_9HYPO|nr:uncharacterized protein JDV02_000125 [Purpureocillium takamizusanense]UNI13375.1 hypothetical protein JDV02_000125 [Purpureocillium takamizusanense]